VKPHEEEATVSLEAMAYYMYISATGCRITADSLSERFPKKGRKYFLRILKELRDAGGIETKREIISSDLTGNTYTTVSRLTEFPERSPQKALLILLLTPYGQLANYSIEPKDNISIKLKYNKIHTNADASRDEEYKTFLKIGETAMDFESLSPEDREYLDEQAREHIAYKEELSAQREQRREEARTEKFKIRDRRRTSPALWTASDSAYYFAELLADRWDVPRLRIKETRFIPALFSTRAKYGTKGDIEKKMAEIYLASPHVQAIKDPEKIWRGFLANFSSLIERAKVELYDSKQVSSWSEQQKLKSARLEM